MRHKTLFAVLTLLATLSSAAEEILILGDSMMRIPSHSLSLQLERRPNVTVRSQTSLGTGLARLDVFDWIAKIDELLAVKAPTMSLVWFGTNDTQPITSEGGTVLQPHTPEWSAEYSRRVGQIMDKLLAGEGSKVYWLELPLMREANATRDITLINELVQVEAGKRDGVHFVALGNVLGRGGNTYSPFVMGARGMPVQVRDVDGVHLSRAGADRLAEHMMTILFP